MPDAVDEAAPEVLLAAPRQAGEQVPAGVEPGRQGRRQADRRRQREGDPRAAVGRQVLLGAGPQEAARRDGDALGGITFHEKLGSQKDRVERVAELAFQIAGSVDAVRGRAARGAARQGRSRVGHGRRVPRAAGPDGPLLRRGRRIKPEIARAIELHYKPKGPTDTVPMAATATPWRSPWRWPTSSTRWWASGPSARSRRAPAIPISCGARRWA